MLKLKKNIKFGRAKFLFFFITLFLSSNIGYSDNLELVGNFLEIKVLDKVSSKNYKLNIKIGEEKIFKNISIKPLKCKNSEFDDSPEVTAYLQVQDITIKNNDQVFIFNGWTFSSSPSISLFDHPIYDIWLTKCY